MARSLEEIATEAKGLSPEDREILAFTLVNDLPAGERARVDALWKEEINRRHEMRVKGASVALSLEETITAVRRRLNAQNPG